MDLTLRTLERQALLGDERALRALERERIRLGRGWHDEPLPPGLRTAAARGLYLWTPPKGYSIELVFVPVEPGDRATGGSTAVPIQGVWISKRQITGLLYGTFARGRANGSRRGPAYVSYEDARAYLAWAGLSMPRSRDWRRASELGVLVDTGSEWLVDSTGAPARTPGQRAWNMRDAGTTFRVCVRM